VWRRQCAASFGDWSVEAQLGLGLVWIQFFLDLITLVFSFVFDNYCL